MQAPVLAPIKIVSGDYVWIERTAAERRHAMRAMIEAAAASAKIDANKGGK